MATEKKLKKLSDKEFTEIEAALPDLSEEDVTYLYDLEVGKSTPRDEVLELLLQDENNDDPDAPSDPEPVVIKKGEFNPKEQYVMCWHEGTKQILQGTIIFNSVTKEKIKDTK
jgi:hypothetical protein